MTLRVVNIRDNQELFRESCLREYLFNYMVLPRIGETIRFLNSTEVNRDEWRIVNIKYLYDKPWFMKDYGGHEVMVELYVESLKG